MKQKLHILFCFMLLMMGAGQAWATETTTTYVFNSRDWTAKVDGVEANWTSNKRASGFTEGQGIQITTSATGANATSPQSFNSISKIVVTYCTNNKSGKGDIKVKIGSGSTKSFSVTAPSSGGTTLKTTEFNYNPTETGKVTLTVDCSTNSVYIYSIAITYDPDQTIPDNPVDPNVAFASEEVSVQKGSTVMNELTKPDDLTVSYSSSNSSIATYNLSTGVVTGVAIGTATITVSWSAVTGKYNEGSKSFDVTVFGAINPEVAFSADSYTISINKSGSNPITKPADLTVRYSSNDTNIATVDENTGEVTGRAVGEATITASWDAVVDKYNEGSVSYQVIVSPNLIVDFEEPTSEYPEWEFSNMTTKQKNSDVPAHGDSYFGTTGGKASASITTNEKIGSPASLTCYVSKQSSNTTTSTWYIQVSEDGTTWEDVNTTSATDMTKGEWKKFTADLSAYGNVYVRVYYNGSTAVRCIDDLTLEIGKKPKMTCSTTAIDAGNIEVGEPTTKTFTVTQSNLTGDVTISADMGVVTPSTIAMGADETTVTWTYTPDSAGEFSAVITVASEDDELSTTISITGSAFVPTPAVPLPFIETFDDNQGAGGNDGIWSGSIALKDILYDNEGWTAENAKGADKCAKFGTTGAGGSATTPRLAFEAGKEYTLSFKGGAWEGDGIELEVDLQLAISRGTLSQSSVTLIERQWRNFTITITAEGPATITFSTSHGRDRFFLDEIQIVDKEAPYIVTIRDIGYATYVAEGDFVVGTDVEVYTVKDNGKAAELTKLEEGTVVNQGTPVLLKAANGAYMLTAATEKGGELTDNDLVAATEPVTGDGTIYVLNSVNGQVGFYKLKSGSVLEAGKAYLKASETTESVKYFGQDELDDTPTCITDVEIDATVKAGTIYNLAGQRVVRPTKGIYIVGGKKVLYQ